MSDLDFVRAEAFDVERNFAVAMLSWGLSVALGVVVLVRLSRLSKRQNWADDDTRLLSQRILPSRWLPWLAPCPALVAVAAFAESVARARALMPIPLDAAEFAKGAAAAAARSLGAQLNTTIVAAFLLPLPVFTGIAVTGLAIALRLRGLGLQRAEALATSEREASEALRRHPSLSPLAVLMIALLPAVLGAFPLWKRCL